MRKFTPGPWEFVGMSSIYGHNRTPVAFIVGEPRTNKENPEPMANARLIAAAPEMYEALKEFTKMFVDTNKYPDPETVTTGLRILFPKAMEIIKKVEADE